MALKSLGSRENSLKQRLPKNKRYSSVLKNDYHGNRAGIVANTRNWWPAINYKQVCSAGAATCEPNGNSLG
jgi:hypothetical protein